MRCVEYGIILIEIIELQQTFLEVLKNVLNTTKYIYKLIYYHNDTM